MTEQQESYYWTIVLFGFITLSVYLFLVRPLLSTTGQRGGAAGRRAQQANARGGQVRPGSRGRVGGRNANAGGGSSSIQATNAQVPSHLSTQSAMTLTPGGSNVLVDGLLAFRHGKASSYEQSLDSETQTANRKQRARILSRLLDRSNHKGGASSLSAPPSKGSTVVVSIPAEDAGCPKLRRVLYLLATFYNLLVIFAIKQDETSNRKQERDAMRAKLRGAKGDADQLPPDILPDQRIVQASTSTGRVAFVRQLQRIELVLEFDRDVEEQLQRFGYKVVVYGEPKQSSWRRGESLLGRELLSDD